MTSLCLYTWIQPCFPLASSMMPWGIWSQNVNEPLRQLVNAVFRFYVMSGDLRTSNSHQFCIITSRFLTLSLQFTTLHYNTILLACFKYYKLWSTYNNVNNISTWRRCRYCCCCRRCCSCRRCRSRTGSCRCRYCCCCRRCCSCRRCCGRAGSCRCFRFCKNNVITLCSDVVSILLYDLLAITFLLSRVIRR